MADDKYPYNVILGVPGLRDRYAWCHNNIGEFTVLWKYEWHSPPSDMAQIKFRFVKQEDYVRFVLTHS